jgi:hypothetical protein
MSSASADGKRAALSFVGRIGNIPDPGPDGSEPIRVCVPVGAPVRIGNDVYQLMHCTITFPDGRVIEEEFLDLVEGGQWGEPNDSRPATGRLIHPLWRPLPLLSPKIVTLW